MVERDIPIFCYWNGCIKDGPDGPFYEGSTLRVIRVKRKTKFAKLLDELYRITGFDKQSFQLDLICRYPTVVQPTMVKYIRLPVVDDSSAETMLEVPTLHPSVSNVDLYLEVKPASDEVIDPVVGSSPATYHGKDRNSAAQLSLGQCSRRQEASGTYVSARQELPEHDRGDTLRAIQVHNGLSEDEGNDEVNYDMGGDADDDMEHEEPADASPHGLLELEASLSKEPGFTEKTTDGLDLGLFTSPVSAQNANVLALPLPATSWLLDRELRKGMVFRDRAELQKLVKMYSIKKQREYQVTQADKHTWEVKCKWRNESGCGWKLRASKRKRHGLFQITIYVSPHICALPESAKGLKSLDVSILADEIESLIRAEPSISIADLKDRVKEKFGHTVPYQKMYAAKQKVITNVFGDWDKSFQILPKFMAALHKSNGTIVEWHFEHLPDPNAASFRRVFWAFSQCIEGFTHCRPLMSIDATDLIGKYKGKMMIATGIDANNQLLPLAFAITEEESSDSWCWFLSCIREKVTQRKGICLISNPHPDILTAVNQQGSQWQEPWAYHRFCLRHLCSKLDEKFHNKQLKDFVYRAGSAHHVGKFDAFMKDIEKINPEARRWLDEIPVSQWALAHDGGRRYGVMTTNLLEVFGTVLKGARDVPVMRCVQLTFDELKSLFDVRGGLANECRNRGDMYSPHVMTKFQGYMTVAKTCNVTPFDQVRGLFQVVTAHQDEQMQVGGKKHVVQLSEGTCTCGKWQLYKFPCSHVLAVCGKLRINGWQYVEDYYSMEKYSQTYAAQFSPVPEESDWPESDLPRLFPDPSCKRSRKGRPSSSRLRNGSDDFKYRSSTVRCCLCGQDGHVSKTCSKKIK